MTAKEYLLQLKRINIELKHIESKMEESRNDAFGVRGIDYSADKVQSSVQSGMPTVERHIDHMNKLQKDYNRLACQKRIIVKQINHLGNNRQSLLLYLRYAKGLTWGAIAGQMNLSKRQFYRLHNAALECFEQKYLKQNNP